MNCSAYNCLSDSRKTKGISYLSFLTEDPPRLKQWLINLKREDFEAEDHSRLCHVHFKEDQFERSPAFLKSLGLEGRYLPIVKDTAVPTLFDYGPPKAKCQQKGKQTFKAKGKLKAKVKKIEPRLSP